MMMERRSRVVVGGADRAAGPKASLMRGIVTEGIRCTKCAQPVLRFAGFAWDDDVGYMHFRNHYPDKAKLLARAATSDAAAYCCVCAWTHCTGIAELKAHDLPWVAS